MNKKTHNTNLSWNPNWVNHQYFLLLQNCVYKQFMPAATDKDGITPYFPSITGRRLRPPGLSTTTEMMLRHPIQKQLLEGGYNPIAGMYLSLAPPYHTNMFLSNFQIFLCLQLCHQFLITSLVSVFCCCCYIIYIVETHNFQFRNLLLYILLVTTFIQSSCLFSIKHIPS